MKGSNARNEEQPFEPTEEWLTAYEDQATEVLAGRARRYAERRARGVAKAGGRGADDLYVDDLVQEALLATFEGVGRWDPAKTPLVEHVISIIRYKTKDDLAHALDHRHVSLDAARHVDPDEEDGADALEDEAAYALARAAPTPDPDTRIYLDQVLAQLACGAAGDDIVAAIVDCWRRGIVDRADVLAETGMSAADHNKGRMRLARLVDDLPTITRNPSRKLG
jgi:DNA-directed RNA polymerase specialized sigma24 family protein